LFFLYYFRKKIVSKCNLNLPREILEINEKMF